MKVIIINGSATSGKDEFVKIFKKNNGFRTLNWSTIDKVKKISSRNFNWNGEKTNEARKFLSEVKRIWTEFNNGPFNDMVDKITKHYNKLISIDQDNVIYFIHCREPKEIQKFVDKYGTDCITLLLIRDDIVVPDNDSDKNVKNYNYDFVIENNGNKSDLKNSTLSFMKKIEEAN